jgi:hypothetical protein
MEQDGTAVFYNSDYIQGLYMRPGLVKNISGPKAKIDLGVLPMCSHELTMQIENKMQIWIVKMKYNKTFWSLMFWLYHLHNLLHITK